MTQPSPPTGVPHSLLQHFKSEVSLQVVLELGDLVLWQSIQGDQIAWHITSGQAVEALAFRSLKRALAAFHTSDPASD